MASKILSDLEALFQRLSEKLPKGAAELRISGVPRGGGRVIELHPANPNAASCSVFADDGDVYTFGFGFRSYWEFPYERRYRYDEKNVILEIEEMSRAVLRGDCEEKRGLISVTGKIFVGEYTYKTTTIPVLSLPLFGTRRYAPYAATETYPVPAKS